MQGSEASIGIAQQFRELSASDWAGVVATFAIFLYLIWSLNQFDRTTLIPITTERVLVVGASSGIGRATALKYASRGAKVAVMARRAAELETVKTECEAAGSAATVKIVGDFTDAGVITEARKKVEKEFGGLDTLIVAAGVASLQPLLTGVAGAVRDKDGAFATGKPTKAGIQRVKEVANAAIGGNYLGPLLTAVSFIPMLELTSKSPAILLVSSAAAIIPAPTRSLYVASKGASLLLYQSLAIEHPRIKFSNVIPATVEGNFRASTVDGGDTKEEAKGVLKRDYVATCCVDAVDRGVKVMFLPGRYRLFHLLYWLFPSVVERGAARKYNWQP